MYICECVCVYILRLLLANVNVTDELMAMTSPSRGEGGGYEVGGGWQTEEEVAVKDLEVVVLKGRPQRGSGPKAGLISSSAKLKSECGANMARLFEYSRG